MILDIREEFDRGEHNSKEVEWPMLEHILIKIIKVYKRVRKEMMDFNDMIRQLIVKERQ